MFRKLLSLGLFLALTSPVFAQSSPGPVFQAAPYLSVPATFGCATNPCGYQQFVPAAAQGLPNIPTNANYALLICTVQTINWTDDGKTTPTASVGMPLTTNTPFIFAERPLSLVQIIQVTASATCNVSYYQ